MYLLDTSPFADYFGKNKDKPKNNFIINNKENKPSKCVLL